MDKLKKKEILEIIESSIDRTVDEPMLRKLEQLLSGDVEAQKFYSEQCQLHAMLAWEHGVLTECEFDTTVETKDDTNAPADSKSSLSLVRRWRLLATAATLLFLASAGWLVYQEVTKPAAEVATNDETTNPGSFNLSNADSSNDGSSNGVSPVAWKDRDVVAVVSTIHGASIKATEFDVSLNKDDEVRTGQFEVTNGFVELTFKNGVEVVIESPAKFQIVSDMQMQMNRGRMSATITEEAEGFAVETPSASLVDYGTEFAVEVLSDDDSEVHVFNGEVRVKPTFALPTMGTVRLVSNQATRVRGKSGIPEGIDIDHSRFVRHLREPITANAAYYEFIESLKPIYMFRMAPSTDGSTLANHGSYSANASIKAAEMDSPPFKPGMIGSSLHLDGPASLAYASVADYNPSTNGELTVCAWVWADSRPRWAAVAKHWSLEFLNSETEYEGLGGQFHFGLHEDDGDLELQVRDAKGKVIKLREEKPLAIGKWQHVAFVVGNGKVQLYRDGKLVASSACDGLATNGPKGMGIGAKLNPACDKPAHKNAGYWHGRIDELGIFHRALSSDEIGRLSQYGDD